MKQSTGGIFLFLFLFIVIATPTRAQWAFQRLTNNTGNSWFPSVSALGSMIHVVWEDRSYGRSEIFYKRSTNNGTSWSFQRITNDWGNSQVPDVDVWGDIHNEILFKSGY